MSRTLLWAALLLYLALHHDLWLWAEGSFAFGLPAGLTYHVLYCLGAALLMAGLLRWLWPTELGPEGDGAGGEGP